MCPSRFWSAGPSISETIYDAGRRSAQTAQARAAYDEAVANYRETVLTSFQEVEDQLAALRILEQESEQQARAVQGAKDSVRLTTNQYEGGIVSYLNVVVVNATALANEQTAVNIQGQRLAPSVQLGAAAGGGGGGGGAPRGSLDPAPSPRGSHGFRSEPSLRLGSEGTERAASRLRGER